MTYSEISFWLITTGILEVVAVFTAMFVVFPSNNGMHNMLKVGFAFMVFGLVVQLTRTSYFLQHGSYPVDVGFPLWITKDIGASILIFYYAFVHRRSTKNENSKD
jgi:type II secretory pathway component PulF